MLPFWCKNNKYNFRTGVVGVYMSASFAKMGSAKLNNPGHALSTCKQLYNYLAPTWPQQRFVEFHVKIWDRQTDTHTDTQQGL